MEAYSFKKFFENYKGVEFQFFCDISVLAQKLAEHLRNLQKHNEFLSQEFNPEMITELFEGFTKEVDGCYKYKSKEIYFFFRNDILAIVGNSKIIMNIPIPKTIEGFINDCNRAEVVLEWKI